MKWVLSLLILVILMASMGFLYVQDPGNITVTWIGYEVQLSLFIGFLLLLLFFFLTYLVLKGLSWFLGIPFRILSSFQNVKDRKARDELLDLLSSSEAEIYGEALQHQQKALGRLSGEPFFLWISGMTFEKAEKPFEAEKCFMDLTKNPSSTFLGLKGRIRAALHRGDFKSAYDLLHIAKKITPTSPWVLKHLLALVREQKKFDEAEALVLSLEDLGYYSSSQSKKQLAPLKYQQALQPKITPSQKEVLLRQSHTLDPSLAEATEIMAPLLQKQGHLPYALNAIEETWELAPTQKLGDLYLTLSSPKTSTDAYQITKKFVKNNPAHPESLLFLARTAFKADLWGEARAHLTELLKRKEGITAIAYQLFADLELAEFKDWKTAIKWLEKGIQAPRHL